MTRKPAMTASQLTAAGAVWRKSSYSSGSGNNCIDVAVFPRTIGVRDSKRPDGDALLVSRFTWSAFVTAVAHRKL